MFSIPAFRKLPSTIPGLSIQEPSAAIIRAYALLIKQVKSDDERQQYTLFGGIALCVLYSGDEPILPDICISYRQHLQQKAERKPVESDMNLAVFLEGPEVTFPEILAGSSILDCLETLTVDQFLDLILFFMDKVSQGSLKYIWDTLHSEDLWIIDSALKKT